MGGSSGGCPVLPGAMIKGRKYRPVQDKPSARREMGAGRGIGEKHAEQTGAVRKRKRMYNLRPKGRNAIMNDASGNGYFRGIRMRPLRAVFRQAAERAPIRGIFQPVPEFATRVIFRRIPGVSPRLIILRQAPENSPSELSSGRAEAALSAHGIRKLLRLLEFRGNIRDDDELCDPLAGLNGLIALPVVEQRDLDLTAVVAVDHADLVCRGKKTL